MARGGKAGATRCKLKRPILAGFKTLPRSFAPSSFAQNRFAEHQYAPGSGSILVRVPRDRTGGFGLHAGTLALLEGLLVAISAAEPDRTKAALEDLNASRQALSGAGMGL